MEAKKKILIPVQSGTSIRKDGKAIRVSLEVATEIQKEGRRYGITTYLWWICNIRGYVQA